MRKEIATMQTTGVVSLGPKPIFSETWLIERDLDWNLESATPGVLYRKQDIFSVYGDITWQHSWNSSSQKQAVEIDYFKSLLNLYNSINVRILHLSSLGFLE